MSAKLFYVAKPRENCLVTIKKLKHLHSKRFLIDRTKVLIESKNVTLVFLIFLIADRWL